MILIEGDLYMGKREAWNKGTKEAVKHVYYTNGEINIRIPEGAIPPEGFVRGRLPRHLSPESNKAAIDKRRQTSLEKYGDPTYNNMQKNRATKLENHGDENYNNREQCKVTCISKYGVDNAFKSDDVKSKIKQTSLDRYGAERYADTEEWKEKVREAWDNKSPEELQDLFDRRNQTNISIYGDNYRNVFTERQRVSCMEKYGVEACCLLPQCRNYSSQDSKPNLQFKDALIQNNLYISDLDSREFVLCRKAFDFKVGDTLIEINPTISHNSTFSPWGDPVSKTYHKEKTDIAFANDYRCIHIFDWDNVDAIINLLKEKERIYARRCDVKEVSKEEARTFINTHHVQGYARDEIRLGLYHNNELISIMTFGKPRYNKKYEYELIRYCSSKNIVGGAEKLFNHFIKLYNPLSIISYCDLSKFKGDVYNKLHFTLMSTSAPSRHWFNMKTNQHITDNLLRQRGFDQLLGKQYGCFGKGTSNEELMLQHDFVEVYDCGQATYVWKQD